MTNEEKRALITQALKRHNELDAAFDKWEDLTGATVDSELGNAIWFLAGEFLRNTSIACGLDKEALDWFIYENRQGKNKYEWVEDGKEIIEVSSLKTFFKAMGI